MSKQKEESWEMVKGDYALESKGSFFNVPRYIPLTVVINQKTGEVKLFQRQRIDQIGLGKALDSA